MASLASPTISEIVIRFIPREEMRPEVTGLGDWWFAEKTLHIRAVGEGDAAFLVALHEMIEAVLCNAAGITTDQVDSFDTRYEQKEDRGEEEEPGDAPDCPYRAQHRQAMLVEHLVAHFLGLTDYGVLR